MARSAPGVPVVAAPRKWQALRSTSWLDLSLSLLLILAFVVVALFPFIWMLRTAFTPNGDAFSLTPSLLPTRFTFENLTRVVTSPNVPFVRYFLNSCLVAFSTTSLVVLLGSWGAYALARLSFRGRRTFGLSLLFIQMFPGILMIIPLFIIFTKLGLVNSFLGLIVAYTAGSLPFTVWILRGYFLSIPREMEDSARIDGCTYLGTLFRIVLPLSAPGLAAVATLAFVHAWNEFFFAYVLIDNDTKYVLSIGLATYVQQFTTDYGGLFAMASLTTLPVVAIFLVFQRYLVGGLTTGSIKG